MSYLCSPMVVASYSLIRVPTVSRHPSHNEPWPLFYKVGVAFWVISIPLGYFYYKGFFIVMSNNSRNFMKNDVCFQLLLKQEKYKSYMWYRNTLVEKSH